MRDSREHAGRFVLAAACLLSPAWVTPARADLFRTERLTLSADFRVRFEQDFDSQSASGLERDDRARLRARARIAGRYRPNEMWEFGFRLRSGSDDSHQSPHITLIDFHDNDTGDGDFNLDKWYVRGTWNDCWAWAGRSSFPFWKQNELMWDDDATLSGIGTGWKGGGEKNRFAVTAGYFSLPVGMREFAGNLGALQLLYETRRDEIGITAAAGLYSFDSNPADTDAALLLNGNGARDYSILGASVQARLEAGGRPFVLGGDYLHNTEDYSTSDPDPVTAANADETDGFVVSARWGKLKDRHDWLVAYYYARIETFAVNASYAQDDWVRWGSATETRSSNMKGHELRYARRLLPELDLVARLYLVEAITTDEDGNRARVDLNYKF